MSPVNAFHVYSSGDLSRHRERKKKKKKRFIDPNPVFAYRFKRARAYFTNQNESYHANFPRDPDPDCHIFQRPVRRSKNSLVKVFYACSSTCVQTQHFPTWRGSDYTWIRSRRAITRLFTQPRAFFFVIPPFHTCKCMIINSRRIYIMYLYHL